MRTRKGIAAIIFTKIRGKKKFLLLKRKLYWSGWEWLKGGRKANESEIEALHREIFEETAKKPENYNAEKTNAVFFFKYERPFVHDNVLWDSAENRVYLIEFDNSRIKLDKDEHSGYRWVSRADALKTITHEDQKKVFEKLT